MGGKQKNPLDRSRIIPEKKPRKAKKSGEEVSEVLVEQEIPNHLDTCVSEYTVTAPETTVNSGNCSTAQEAEFFVNNCCPDKDLHIQQLQEQLKKAENELKILKEKLKKVGEKKGLKCGDGAVIEAKWVAAQQQLMAGQLRHLSSHTLAEAKK